MKLKRRIAIFLMWLTKKVDKDFYFELQRYYVQQQIQNTEPQELSQT